LIEFESTSFKTTPLTEWIFFSSKNAVRSFFELGYSLNKSKLACIGKGTAKELKKHVSQVNFIGDNIDIKVTALQFATELGNSKCLFPISNISNKTIQKALNDPSQANDVIVYNTYAKAVVDIPQVDLLIFTSPSNVRSYFLKHQVHSHQTVIAIGPSTGNELILNGVIDHHTPEKQGEIGIIDLIKRIKYRTY
jgi:uroporphyrinogen-III synthase